MPWCNWFLHVFVYPFSQVTFWGLFTQCLQVRIDLSFLMVKGWSNSNPSEKCTKITTASSNFWQILGVWNTGAHPCGSNGSSCWCCSALMQQGAAMQRCQWLVDWENFMQNSWLSWVRNDLLCCWLDCYFWILQIRIILKSSWKSWIWPKWGCRIQ